MSLQTFEFDTKLLKAPKTLKDLVQQFKQKGHTTLELNNSHTKHSFFNNIIIDIFLFTAAIISMMATAAIIRLICRHTKLKALLTGITFQPVKQTEAIYATTLYSTMVYNSSINFNDYRFSNLYFCINTYMHYI